MASSSPGSAATRRTLLEWLLGATADTEIPATRLAAALGAKDGDWADWLVHAADALGWESERIRACPKAVEGEHDSHWVTCCPDDRERWLVFSGVRGEDAHATLVDARGAQGVPIAPARLARALELEKATDEVTWVRLTPVLPLHSLRSPPEGPKITPLRRLARWAKLERKTVLAVVAYSAVISIVSLALPLAVQTLVDLLAFSRVLQPLLIVSAALLVVLLLAAGLRVLEVYIVELLERRVFANLARDFARRLPAAKSDAGGKWGLTERINRFFDVVGAQKTSASLLLSAVEVVMSTAAGLLILAFYHPYLLVFDLVVVGSLAFIVFRLGRGGIDSAVKESSAKYELAAWLESVARRPSRFVTPEGASWSARQTDRLVVSWLTKRDDHFGIVLRQTIGFAGVQALASGALLGLGGFLVWINELSLGQLVAAELIITGVTAQLAKLGRHAESFYDLSASVDKLGLLMDLETEPLTGDMLPRQKRAMRLELQEVSLPHGRCSLKVEPGERVAIAGMPLRSRRMLFDAVYAREMPEGRILVDDVCVTSLAPRALRSQIALLRRPQPVGASLEDNLTNQDTRSTVEELRELLHHVGLGDLLGRQPEGLQTWVYPNGSPFSHRELVALEVARAIRAQPRLVLVDGAFDRLDDPEAVDRLWSAIAGPEAPWTVVLASDRDDLLARCERRQEWVDDRLEETAA